MANLSVPAPFESDKSTSLHDRTNRPGGPSATRMELGKRWAGFAAATVLGVGATALLFSVRDSWENHREWLVTMIPFLVIAAIGLAHLVIRKQVVPLVPGATFLFLALIFAGADVILDSEGGRHTERDVVSILGGVALGISVACFVVALIWVEIRRPTKAPTPQL